VFIECTHEAILLSVLFVLGKLGLSDQPPPTKKKYLKKKEKKRAESNYIGQAADRCLFTGAIPLLIDTGTFACCVSALGLYVPP
jgi:hypothetical protein